MKYLNRKYVTLQTGEEMFIVSDNIEERTMHLYPKSKEDDYDCEWCTATEYEYNEIKGYREGYEELANILFPLGFTQETPGKFFHKLCGCSFDLSGCSVEGVIKIVFRKGYDSGYENAQQKVKEAIGIY